MTNKFDLHWRMTFEFRDGRSDPITVSSPLTVEFDIKRSGKSDDQNAVFRLYNLNPAKARTLFKDILSDNEDNERINLYFEVGYGESYTLVYRGTVLECNTYRDGGSTETITEVLCFDLNMLKYIGKTYSDRTPVKEVIKDVAKTLELDVGSIGDIQKKIKGNFTIAGDGIEALENLTGGCVYNDNGVLRVLMPDECVDKDDVFFNSHDFFGTPRRNNGFVTFTTRLSPAVDLFQLVVLEDTIQPESNGKAKVFEIRHNGMISASVPCSAQTTLSCWQGNAKSNIPLNIINNTTKEVKKDDPNPPQSNTETKNFLTTFKKVKNEEIVEVGSSVENLPYIQRDLETKGTKARSLNKRVLGRVLWHEIVDYPNLTGSQRPNLEQINNIYNTLRVLLDFINKNIGNKAIVCTSGWRSIANNRAVDGKSNSKHLQGKAIDFHFSTPELTQKMFYEVFAKKWTYGWKGYYATSNPWIHIQIDGNQPDRR